MVVTDNKRIAKNTLYLYIRVFFTMLISLYISRVTLELLGVEDYGIYNVVGGIVTLMTILTAAFSNSTQRFLSYSIGTGNEEDTHKYFLTFLNIHILLSLFLFIVAEACAYWLISVYLNIPEDRIFAAHIVFQFSLITAIVNLISAPYMSLVIAEEAFSIFAYIGIGEQIVKLGGILLLFQIKAVDSLIYYGAFLLVVAIAVRVIYQVFCHRKYSNIIAYKVKIYKECFIEIWKFISWAYLGNFSGIFKEQGINLLIGHFFGVKINAARGVSMQVYSAISLLGLNLVSAFRPQITKNYASGNIEHSISLMSVSTKYTYFLMYLFALPLLLETPMVLSLWLKNVPDYAVIFTRLVIILCLVRSVQEPLNTLYLAIGRIKASQILAVIYSITTVLICYFIFKCGAVSYYSVYLSIFIDAFAIIPLLYLTKRLIPLSFHTLLKDVLFPIIVVTLISCVISYLWVATHESSLSRLLISSIISLSITLCSIYLFGLKKSERSILYSYMKSKIKGSKA